MSAEVDQRIVSMQFDNAQFEAGIKQSVKSLQKLDESLELKNASKGLEDVDKEAKKVDLSSISTQIEALGKKFSASSIVAITALQNITNSVVNTTKNFAKALTIDPVKTGMQEYEEKLNSIQTILANTKRYGTTMSDVSQALNALNVYADKTIYNFSQMTQAIGQFTTQGVELEKSVNAVKGISNLAAFVGAPASDASRAMFQLSQALSTGTVRLQDWMSLEHTAGMGGKEFQDRLIATARVYNTGIDKAIKKNGNFRESLKEGWLTTEVLTDTLAQFAGAVDEATLKQKGFTDEQIKSIMALGKTAEESATVVKTITQLTDTMKESVQSGWAQSWEYILGDMDQAKSLLTAIAKGFDTITGASATARNEMLKMWNEKGGRAAIIQGVLYLLKGVGPMFTAIGKAMNEVFPPKTGKDLTKASKAFRDLAKNFKMSDEACVGLKNVLTLVLKPLGLVWSMAKTGVRVIGTITGYVLRLTDKLLSLAFRLDEVENPFKNLISSAEKAQALEAVRTIINNITSAMSFFTGAITKAVGNIDGIELLSKALFKLSTFGHTGIRVVILLLEKLATIDPSVVIQGIETLKEKIKNLLNAAKNIPFIGTAFEAFSEGAKRSKKVLLSFASQLKNIPKLMDSFRKMISELLAFPDILSAISFLASGIVRAIKNGPLGPAFEWLLGVFSSVVDGVSGLVSSVMNSLKRLDVGSIGIIVFGAVIIKTISQVGKAFELFGTLAKSVSKAVHAISKGFGNVFMELSKGLKSWRKSLHTKMILQIAAAIGILAASLIALTFVDGEKLITAAIALGGVTVALAALVAGLAVLTKVTEGNEMAKMAGTLVLLSSSILVLVEGLKELSGINFEGMGLKLLVLAGVFAALITVAAIAARTGHIGNQLLALSVTLISFSVSMKLLSDSLSDIAGQDSRQIGKVAASLIGVMIMLGILSRTMKNVKFTSSVGIILLLAGLRALVPTLASLSKNKKDLINAMSTLALLTLVIRQLGRMSQNINEEISTVSKALISMSVAALLLSVAAKRFGSLSSDEFKKGLVAIGVCSLCFAALTQVSRFAGAYGDKAGRGILSMSMAAVILSVAAKRFGEMDPGELTKALSAITILMALFSVVTVASIFAGSNSKTITQLTVAISALSIAMGLLTLIDSGRLLKAASTLGIVMLSFASVLEASGNVANKKQMKNVLAMTAIVIALGAGLSLMADLPVQRILPAATGLGVLLTAIASSLLILKRVGNVSNSVLGQVAILAAIVAGLSAAMSLLSTITPESSLANSVSLGVLLTIVSSNLLILSKAGEISKSAYIGVAALTAVVIGLSAALLILQNSSPEASIANATALSILLTALMLNAKLINSNVSTLTGALKGLVGPAGLLLIVSGLALILSKLSDVNPQAALATATGLSELLVSLSAASVIIQFINPAAALAGVLGLIAVVAGMGLLIAGLGALAKIDGFEELMKDGGRVLESIGSAIGGFFGGIVSGFVGGASKSFVEIGKNLTAFATEAEPFFRITANSVTAESMEGIKALAQAILILTSSDVMGNIAKFFGGGESSLVSFGKELAIFAPYYQLFGNIVGKIQNVDNLKPVVDSIRTMIAAASELENKGGLWQKVVGESESMAEFADGMVPVGKAVVKLSKVLKKGKVNFDLVDSATAAARSLAAFANEIPKSDGLWQGITGFNDLRDFTNNLAPLAAGIVNFSNTLKAGDIDFDLVKRSTAAAQSLAALANNLPSTGSSVFSWFSGSQDLGVFGDQLTKFGEGFASYYTSIQGINTDVITASTSAAKALSNFADEIPDTSWLDNIFATDMDRFIRDLVKFGVGFAVFYEKIKGITPMTVQAATNSMSMIVDVCEKAASINADSLDDFISSLEDLGEANVSGFVNAFNNSQSSVEEGVSNMIRYASNAIQAQKPTLILAFKDITESAIETIKTSNEKYVNAGSAMITSVTTGVNKKQENLKNAITDETVGMFSEAFKSLTEEFQKLGKKISSLTKKLANIKIANNDVSKSFEKVSNSSKKAAKNVKTVGDKAKSSKKKISEMKKESTKTSTEVKKMGDKSKTTAKQIDKVKTSSKDASKKTEDLGEKAKDTGDKIEKAGDQAETTSDKISKFFSLDKLKGSGIGNVFENIGNSLTNLDTSSISDAEKKAEKERKKAEKEAKRQQKETEKSLSKLDTTSKKSTKSTQDTFKSFTQSLKSSLKGATGLFDELEQKEKVSTDNMIQNMRSQIVEISKWSENLVKLQKRGLNKGLLKSLAELGVSGAGYVQSLVKASNKTLAEMNDVYIARMRLNETASKKIANSFKKAGWKAAKAYQDGLKGTSKKTKKLSKNFGAIPKDETVKYAKSYAKTVAKMASLTDKANQTALITALNSKGTQLTGSLAMIMNSYQKYTIDGLTTVAKKMSVGQEALDAFVSAYIKSVPDIDSFTSAVKVSGDVITAYINKLYKASDYYEEDTAALKENQKELKKSQKAQKKAEKTYNKANKKYKKKQTEATKARREEAKSALKEAQKTTKAAEKAVLSSQKTMANHTKEVYENLKQSIKENVDSFLDPLSLSFDTGIDIFAEFDTETIASKKLLQNIQSQIGGYEQYMKDVQALTDRGFSNGLVRYIQDMGVAGAKYASTFAKMTEEEQKKADKMWNQKEKLEAQTLVNNQKKAAEDAVQWAESLQQLATKGFSQSLIEQLGAQGVSSLDQVRAFLTMTPDQAAKFQQSYESSLKLSDTIADKVISSYAYAGGSSVKGFLSAISKVSKTGTAENNQLAASMKNAAKSASGALTSGMKSAANSGIKKLTKTLLSKSNTKSVTSTGKEVGENVDAGMIKGINSGSSAVSTAASQVAKGALQSAAKTLDIHSPSGKFEEYGKYIDQGLAIGVTKNAKSMYDKVSYTMKQALDSAYEVMEKENDSTPTITPIIDLTNIQNGVDEIESMWRNRVLSPDMAAIGAVASINSSVNAADPALLKAIQKLTHAVDNMDAQEVSVNNVFHITSSAPKAVAEEVSDTMQFQVERKNAVWA